MKHIVLAGGGHSHALVLLMSAMKPIRARFTLISEQYDSPYSGMLPAAIAGIYTEKEIHLDLAKLALQSGADFVHAKVIGLSREKREVYLENHPPIRYDLLSLNLGSRPGGDFPGSQWSTPIKPVRGFLAEWKSILNEFQNPGKPQDILILGGGAGGVETAWNMHSALKKANPNREFQIHLFHKTNDLLTGIGSAASGKAKKICNVKGIQLHLESEILEIRSTRNGKELKFRNGSLRFGENERSVSIFRFTTASSQPWLSNTGLELDPRGFIRIRPSLQTISDDPVFAVGDIASWEGTSIPKAGVYAVRMAKTLYKNLDGLAKEKSKLHLYKPQRIYLALLGEGSGKALAVRGKWCSGPSRILWKWKDHIDRKFMNRFHSLPAMTADSEMEMQCAACGSKASSEVLTDAFSRWESKKRIPWEDASIHPMGKQSLCSSIDFFRLPSIDPYILGKVATLHCLNDLYAMGAVPKFALSLAVLPFGEPKRGKELLFQLLSGARETLEKEGAELSGGHTSEGMETAFGLSCHGILSGKSLPKQIRSKTSSLILTKPIGSGALLAAWERQKLDSEFLEELIEFFLQSQKAASEIFLTNGATACTDVSGFGLLGHLSEMLPSGGAKIQLNLNAIPVYRGSISVLEKGIQSSLQTENEKLLEKFECNGWDLSPFHKILFDPQTSGGLLSAVPHSKTEKILNLLNQAGYKDSVCIGEVILEKKIPKNHLELVWNR